MTSRLLPFLLPLLTLSSLSRAAFRPLNATMSKDHGIPTIDFAKSHYDVEHCGKSTAGRARRGFGDDYIDGLDFSVDDSGEAAVGEIPWAVAIITRIPGPAAPRLCAGTLVSSRHVLSAAHCFARDDVIPTNFGHVRCKTGDHFDLNDFADWSEVKYGGECLHASDSSCADSTLQAKTAGIKNITLFPFFTEDCSRGSDLVIIELDRDVDVPHACLPHLHELADVTLMANATLPSFHTFAWGTDKSKELEKASRLQKSGLTIKRDRCAKKTKFLSTDVLCAAKKMHIEQCLGESGAGLMASTGGRTFLVGVLSSSSACAPGSQTGLDETRFTDVRLFSATIDRAIGTVGPLPDFS